MSGQYTAQPPKCADKKCDVVWVNPDGHMVFTICWLCIVLLFAHIIINARRRGIVLKRSRKDWKE